MKKESHRLNMSISNVYHTFIARRLLEKISESNNSLILVKGSSAETAYLGNLVRSIVDVDLAGLKGLNFNEDLINNVLLNEDGKQINFSLVGNPKRTPTGIYKISCTGNFGEMKQDLNIDFQADYNRLIEPEKRIMPKIFEGDNEFEVNVPSFEEYLAEKLCIIAESNKTDVLNTRLKDFYDIQQLHGDKYDSDKLTYYFGIMLRLRNKINLNTVDTSHLNKAFLKNHIDMWNNTKRKYDFLDNEVSFEEAMYYTKAVLREELQRNGFIQPENKNIKYLKNKRITL